MANDSGVVNLVCTLRRAAWNCKFNVWICQRRVDSCGNDLAMEASGDLFAQFAAHKRSPFSLGSGSIPGAFNELPLQ